MLEGIDVSRWQGTVIWKDVADSGKKFAVARSSIGQQTKDEEWVRNYQRMVANGIVPGAYHLVSGDSSGASQAANWKDSLDQAGFDKGLLVLDVEGWSGTLNGLEAGTLRATEYLCDWIRNTYNRQPIIYTGVYWRENLKQHPDNFGSRLWLSYYGTNDPQNYVPKAWVTWKIWQYTSTGSVPGIEGNVDINKFKGTESELKEYAGWEWDEMATQEEIRQIVAAENAKVVAEVKNQHQITRTQATSNADAVVTAVNAQGNRLSNELDVTEQNVKTEILNSEARLTNLIGQAVAGGGDVDLTEVTQALDEIKAAVDASDVVAADYYANLVTTIKHLHKHLCLPCVADETETA